MGRRNRLPSLLPPLSSDDDALRARFPRAAYWILGTELTEEERSAAFLRGGSGQRGSVEPRLTASRVRDSSSAYAGDRAFSHASYADAGSSAESYAEADAVPAVPVNVSVDPVDVASNSHPEGYQGPCWECVADSFYFVSQGDDSRASSILGACRHRPSSNPASSGLRRPSPLDFPRLSIRPPGTIALLI